LQAFILDSAGNVEHSSQEVEKELDPNADSSEVVPPFNGYAKAATEEVCFNSQVNVNTR